MLFLGCDITIIFPARSLMKYWTKVRSCSLYIGMEQHTSVVLIRRSSQLRIRVPATEIQCEHSLYTGLKTEILLLHWLGLINENTRIIGARIENLRNPSESPQCISFCTPFSRLYRLMVVPQVTTVSLNELNSRTNSALNKCSCRARRIYQYNDDDLFPIYPYSFF